MQLFVLRTPTIALCIDVGPEHLVTLPTGAVIRPLSSHPDARGLIRFQYDERTYAMFVQDFEQRTMPQVP